MNFWKSVFSDDPDPPEPESKLDSAKAGEEHEALGTGSSPEESDLNQNPSAGGGWNFGGLIQTLATKSESVLEVYRRDLQEFGSGLKKEIEVAHGSLETVGHAIDEIGSTVLKGTAQIISQGKDAILAAEHDSDSSDTNSSSYGARRNLNPKGYSRFDAQVRMIQGDINTYCEEPEDLNDYSKWNLGFVLEEKRPETERLLEENSSMKGVYKRVVPDSIDHETFWSRYFYKVHKLKQTEDLRANLVKRAIAREDEEELSWDVDDDDDEVEDVANATKKASELKLKENEEPDKRDRVKTVNEPKAESSSIVNEVNSDELQGEKDSSEKKDLGAKDSEKVVKEEISVQKFEDGSSGAAPAKGVKVSDADDNVENVLLKKENLESKPDTKASSETNAASGESSSEFSVVSSQAPVHEEEDLGWDEIEDLSSLDDKKPIHSGSSPNRVDLRKRLTAAEEEEDLSWDIEDDDEPVKA